MTTVKSHKMALELVRYELAYNDFRDRDIPETRAEQKAALEWLERLAAAANAFIAAEDAYREVMSDGGRTDIITAEYALQAAARGEELKT